MFNLLISSGDKNNILESIQKGIFLQEIKKYCPPNIYQDLESLYPEKLIYCWALSDGNCYNKTFSAIESNRDMILLKQKPQPRDNLRFNWIGKIILTYQRCSTLGKSIWKNERWSRIIFLTRIKTINLSRTTLYAQYGWKDNGNVYQRAILKSVNDSIENFYNFCEQS